MLKCIQTTKQDQNEISEKMNFIKNQNQIKRLKINLQIFLNKIDKYGKIILIEINVIFIWQIIMFIIELIFKNA